MFAIDIKKNFAVVLDVRKNGKFFDVRSYETLQKDKLSSYLKNKKEYFVTTEVEEEIEEKISLPSLLKNHKTIENAISLKLQQNYSSKKSIFNFSPLPNSEDIENISYAVEGVFEDEYLSALELVGDVNHIKRATTAKFSLLAISNKCLDVDSYFSVYTYGNNIIIIAVHNKKIIFSRSNTIVANNAELRILNTVEEINQTINYARGQFRDVKFSTVAVSGSVAIDDTITEHLFLSLSYIGMSVLYPNTFINGLSDEEAQICMLSIGSLFIDKFENFIPKSILGSRQFNIASDVMLYISLVFMIVSSIVAFESYMNYSDSKDIYESNRTKLMQSIKKSKTYSKEELNESLNYLQIAQKYLKYNLIDLLIDIKPLMLLHKPDIIEWSHKEDIVSLKATFTKQFNSLEELYSFEKEFRQTFGDLNVSINKTYTNSTDYAKLNFVTNIVIDSKKETNQDTTTKRRRAR